MFLLPDYTLESWCEFQNFPDYVFHYNIIGVNNLELRQGCDKREEWSQQAKTPNMTFKAGLKSYQPIPSNIY